jgi:hypothetical protein
MRDPGTSIVCACGMRLNVAGRQMLDDVVCPQCGARTTITHTRLQAADAPAPAKVSKTTVDKKEANLFLLLYWYAGALALIIGFVFAFWAFSLPGLRPHQFFILSWILPLTSGIVAGAFSGSITTKVSKSEWKGLFIAATGGSAVWLITFLILPRILPPVHLDPDDVAELNGLLQQKYGKDVRLEFVTDQNGRVRSLILINLGPADRTEVIRFLERSVPPGTRIEVDPPPEIRDEINRLRKEKQLAQEELLPLQSWSTEYYQVTALRQLLNNPDAIEQSLLGVLHAREKKLQDRIQEIDRYLRILGQR